MAIGVEAAGFVLAAFPIVIEGLKFYLKGLETIKGLWRYHLLIQPLILGIEMEEVKFRNSLEALLEDLIMAGELESTLENPNLFSREDIQSSLRERLGPSFEVFLATVADMTSRLEELKVRLGLNGDGRVSKISIPQQQPIVVQDPVLHECLYLGTKILKCIDPLLIWHILADMGREKLHHQAPVEEVLSCPGKRKNRLHPGQTGKEQL